MKSLFYIILFIIIAGCSTNKVVYWCGDHPCINKKEKEAYFKKTMIVEIKTLNKKTSKNNSEIEKIIQQAQVDEKIRIKKEKDHIQEAKLEEKRRIKEEKNLAKQVKLEEKRRIKEEKDLTKIIARDKKEKVEEKRIESKQSVDIDFNNEKASSDSPDFKQLVEKITRKNTLRPYPDINDIPN